MAGAQNWAHSVVYVIIIIQIAAQIATSNTLHAYNENTIQ